MKKYILENAEVVALVCSIVIRIAGTLTTIEAFSGNGLIAGVCGVITGAAYEVKTFVEKKQIG